MSNADKGEPTPRGVISEEDRAAMRQRASELGRRLDKAREGEVAESGRRHSAGGRDDKGMGPALRLSTELIGGILVGSAIGWFLDQPYVFGTWPAMFIVFFLLGSAAGMLNVVRAGMKMKTGPSDPSKGPSVRDDDEDA
ncbi:MAG: AtpZ/AtpI family protein [Hyphomicrobiaceae bacterium]|nr:AtpZ/AtpI family protein [Hyphomicrobiaceae bacterium]